MKRTRGHGRGPWVLSAKDFLDLGNRATVDQSLSRVYTGAGRCGVWDAMWLGPSLTADSSMLDRLSQRLPMAVIIDLADGLSTLPTWAAPIARKITTLNPC
jgi:hypothetical protein